MHIFSRPFSVAFLLAGLLCGSGAYAQALPDSNHTIERLQDAYGIRLGVVGNYFKTKSVPIPNTYDAPSVTGGWRPALNPYYEAPLSRGLTASYELMLVYRSFSALNFSDFRFQSYGFDCEVRWDPPVTAGDAAASQQPHLYYSGGAGFDTFSDRVSLSLPLSAGELIPFSNRAELEVAARVAPQLFLGNGPGMYYGIIVGIRMLDPK
jgi:hypothetical protein